MKRAYALLALALALPAAADTAPLGALRSATPVVTNEVDAAWLEWLTNSTAILLGSGASNRAGGPAIPWITRDVSIGAGAESCESVSIGWGATSGVYSAAVGPDTYAATYAAAVGLRARASDDSVAIGKDALAAAPHSVQLGEGRNDQSDTVKIYDWTLLDSRGIIPPARLGSMPMRAHLYSGGGCRADPAVYLYWSTNCTTHSFPISANLPDDADAMQWDLWITAGSAGFRPAVITGVSWVGPNGPPDASAVSPGSTLITHCTAIRLPPTNVVVLAEWRATVEFTPVGAVPAPPRVPGRIRVRSSGIPVMANGAADVYTVSLSSGTFAAIGAIPVGADGIEYEVWLHNVSESSITPTIPSGGGTLVGEMPSIPSGGRCILRCRTVPGSAYTTDTIITVAGVTPAGRGVPDSKGGGGHEEEEAPGEDEKPVADEPVDEEPSGDDPGEEDSPGGGDER